MSTRAPHDSRAPRSAAGREPTTPPAGAPVMPGQAVIAFERIGTACAATALRTALAASPLRLLAPRNHGDAAWVFLSNLGGGLVDGDRVQVKVDVGPGASALLGGGLIVLAWRLWRQSSPARAAVLFHFSLLYLALLFAAMVVDRLGPAIDVAGLAVTR